LPTYRAILVRVAMAAAGLALAVGFAAYWIDMELVDERIASLATRQSAAFLAEERALLAGGARDRLKSDLATFMARNQNNPEGQFIVAELYDPQRTKLAEEVEETSEWAEDMLKQYRHEFPTVADGFWYRRFHANGTILVQTMTPLAGPKGELLGYFEGVYQLSKERSQELTYDALVVVGASVLSVLGAALVLLPIFASFNRGIMSLSRQLLDANIDTLAALGGTIAKRDSDTHTHNFRVTILAICLAETLKLDGDQIRSLIKGAFLHDVGKIGIPDNILLKPGRLDEAEFEIMKTHVQHGIDIVSRSAWLTDARDVVGCHHEKVDGSGYPNRLKGDAIPINARIFAIADVFDALTSKRPYKDAMPFEKAMSILEEGRGKHFDSSVLDVFARIAQPLHNALGAKRDDEIEMHMRQLVSRYFRSE
jgi:HD-GYP domain-containing protein (c-di-GMP phosphodiesterase class II)